MNFFVSIWDSLVNGYRWTVHLSRRIWRMLTWIPFLWKDEDFDYSYLLKMMEEKMKRLRCHFIDHGMISDEEIRDITHQILTCEQAIARITEGSTGYIEKELNEWEAKWGEWKPAVFSIVTPMDKIENQKHKEVMELYEIGERKLQADYDTLFQTMRVNIERWWD